MILRLNDGHEIIIQSIEAENGQLTIRLYKQQPDNLRLIFEDAFATKRMECEGDVFEGYTQLDHITEYVRSEWEVVLSSGEAGPIQRIHDLEDKTTSLEGETTDIQLALAEVYELIIG